MWQWTYMIGHARKWQRAIGYSSCQRGRGANTRITSHYKIDGNIAGIWVNVQTIATRRCYVKSSAVICTCINIDIAVLIVVIVVDVDLAVLLFIGVTGNRNSSFCPSFCCSSKGRETIYDGTLSLITFSVWDIPDSLVTFLKNLAALSTLVLQTRCF